MTSMKGCLEAIPTYQANFPHIQRTKKKTTKQNTKHKIQFINTIQYNMYFNTDKECCKTVANFFL